MEKKVGTERTRTLPTGPIKNNSSSGFTFIELLVVIFILGIFTALLSIKVGGVVSGGDLRLASRIIMGKITELRGRAAYSHREQLLGFQIEKDRLFTVDPAADEYDATTEKEEIQESAKLIHSLPEGVQVQDVVIHSRGKIQSGEAVLKFFPNGCVERSLVHLKNEDGSAHTLEINPITGQVRVHDRYVDQTWQ
jgi:prepilin-type N-terminal cleavage/methylation domain-containing protein